jgi:hypothetical protein
MITLRPSETENLDLAWDKRDASGQPVPPGEYHIVISRFSGIEGGGMVSLDQPFIITILPEP